MIAQLALLWKERNRYWKVIWYRDLTTGKPFGLLRAARYVLKNPPAYDREWEDAMIKADRLRKHCTDQDRLNRMMGDSK